jgi:alpha-L-fucosidase
LAPEHQAIPADPGKPMEICTTLCPGSWGWLKAGRGRHFGPEQVWERLREARGRGYNLLLNTGLRPDGSLDPEDVETLRRVGGRLHREGFPGEDGGNPAPLPATIPAEDGRG